MITLKQAIKVLRLSDDIIVTLTYDERKHILPSNVMSVKKIKETYDLTKIYVTYIHEDHDMYDGTFYGFTFVIRDRRN